MTYDGEKRVLSEELHRIIQEIESGDVSSALEWVHGSPNANHLTATAVHTDQAQVVLRQRCLPPITPSSLSTTLPPPSLRLSAHSLSDRRSRLRPGSPHAVPPFPTCPPTHHFLPVPTRQLAIHARYITSRGDVPGGVLPTPRSGKGRAVGGGRGPRIERGRPQRD